MEPINLDKAREVLAAAVATQGPDFVYNPGGVGVCYYRPLVVGEGVPARRDGQGTVPITADDPRTKTGCLVGVALDLAGVEYDHTSQVSAAALCGYATGHRLATDAATEYLQAAQTAQDSGATWGAALRKAEDLAASYKGTKL